MSCATAHDRYVAMSTSLIKVTLTEGYGWAEVFQAISEGGFCPVGGLPRTGLSQSEWQD